MDRARGDRHEPQPPAAAELTRLRHEARHTRVLIAATRIRLAWWRLRQALDSIGTTP